MQTKEILSNNNSKQSLLQSCPEARTANSHFVQEKGGFLREVMSLRLKKKSKSKVLFGRFWLHHSEEEQRALQFLHIHCSNVNSYSSAPESNKQNPLDRTLDLPFLFRYNHITSLKNVPSPVPRESLPY